MSKHLTGDGALTSTQESEAKAMNISNVEYTEIVLKRLAESFEPNNEEVIVKAKNPVIVVGHGGGWYDQVQKIRHTKIPIIATDVCSIPMISDGIIPDYIVTFEEATKRINETLFNFQKIAQHKIQVIGSKITRNFVYAELEKVGQPFRRFNNYVSSRCSNVGVFGTLFARDELRSDAIILIGMNSWADDYGHPYLAWYTDWRHLIKESMDGLIINCTQGGLIYEHKVIKADFSKLKIDYGLPT